MARKKPVLIAGAGIAGLSAALFLARKGFSVRLFEKSTKLEQTGAGLQLSPNATRLLKQIGVLDRIAVVAVEPNSVSLKDARTARRLATIPLGERAGKRWSSPYLVTHRADLQTAFFDAISEEPLIEIRNSAEVTGVSAHDGGVSVQVRSKGQIRKHSGRILIGADGIWSRTREKMGNLSPSRFSGYVAWRATALADPASGIAEMDTVTVFLDPRFHLIAYPVRGGTLTNLVVVTKGQDLPRQWLNEFDSGKIKKTLSGTCLSELALNVPVWSAWPVHSVDPDTAWFGEPGIVLIGDAAHALTPFAAQGAAMAIEDAAVLAECLAGGDFGEESLRRYEMQRRPRIRRVARRGAFNRFVWHASGIVALARNVALRTRPTESFLRDFDWLYGFDAISGMSGD